MGEGKNILGRGIICRSALPMAFPSCTIIGCFSKKKLQPTKKGDFFQVVKDSVCFFI